MKVVPYLQLIVGALFLFSGTASYVRNASWTWLLLMVLGAVLVVIGGVLIGIRQVISEEWTRLEAKDERLLKI